MTTASVSRRALRDSGSRRYVGAVWGLLLFNSLGYVAVPLIIPFPKSVGQILTMGALVAAFGLAILINPRMRIQPSPYLLLLTVLLIFSTASSVRLESGLGSIFRCVRFAVFLATLWLVSRWWNGDLSFARRHIRALAAVLLTILVGLLLAPGKAFSELYPGRLVGVLWPIPPTQVGQYAAVCAGLTIVLGLTRRIDTRSAVLIGSGAVAVLLMSHTRTALFALIVGVLAALLSLSLSSGRARRAITVIVLTGVLVATTLMPAIQVWLARGQDTEDLSNLTGRQKVWDALLAAKRTPMQEWAGYGLTNKSFDGLPIDNSWLAIYYDQGLIGVGIVGVLLLTLLAAIAVRPPSPQRACALYLVVYVIAVSYTEVGLGDVSPYFLHLGVAAALVARGGPSGGRSPGE